MARRIVATFLIALMVCFGSVRGVRAQEPAPAAATAKTAVPVFSLNGPVTESPAGEAMPLFEPPGVALTDVIQRMHKAAKDPAVKAVVLVCDQAMFGQAQAEELRQAIAAIRAGGKDVYAHADSLSLREYLLLSSASRLSVTPTSIVWIGGIHGEAPYLRGLLDKLGVVPDFQTCGAYKSAAEMFTRTEPSKEADENTNWLLDGMFSAWVKQIADSRKMQPDQVKKLIDVGLYSGEKAKDAGLVDAVEHRQDFEAMLRQKLGGDIVFDRKYGKPAEQQLDLSNPFAMFKIWGELLSGGPKKAAPAGPSVAVVYVDGMIVPGSKDPSPFAGAMATSSDIRRALDKAAEDDSVKAVVLRVSSPGGSAVASEIILDGTKRVRAKKPFAVSMGDVAGSGGYYVACGADTIFADETTITGSIGVVGGKMVTNGMWAKVGITFKEYERGNNADLFATSKPFDDAQRKHLQAWMDEIYGVFKGHVTAARGTRLKKPLDELAGGRVYTGRQALELGLVDQIGTLNDAVRHVAKQAKLEDGAYTVRVIPEPKNFVEALLEGLSGERPDDARHLAMPKSMTSSSTTTSITDLALPYLKQLDPQRVSTVRSALLRLDLLQRESVILTTPEITIGQ